VIFGKPRYLGIVEITDLVPEKGSKIIVDTMRGTEMAVVAGPITEIQEEKFRTACTIEPQEGQAKGGEPLLQNVTFNSLPAREDFEATEDHRGEEREVLIRSRELLREHELPMKLVDVEFLLDRKKLFFYFTSDQRVDFRAYVRDLAREFKTRIELRQIGVRDEAKAVKGLGPCGLPCCCSYWLHSFTPICIKMVKEQNLALNPTKISGICGRLMCCMSYEHEIYRDIWDSLPNPGAKIKSQKGNFILSGVDLSRNCAKIRSPEGAELNIPLKNFETFRTRVMQGEEWEDLLHKGLPVLITEERKPSSARSVPEKTAQRKQDQAEIQKKTPSLDKQVPQQEGAKEPRKKGETGKPPHKRKKRKRPGKPQEDKGKKMVPAPGKHKARKKKGKPAGKQKTNEPGSSSSSKENITG